MMGRSARVTADDLKAWGVVEINGKFYGPNTPEALAVKSQKKEKKKRKVVGSKNKIDLFVRLVKAELGIDLVKEHEFHPERRWRFDYACIDKKIAIEVEGGIWIKGGGAHSRPQNILRDMEKYTAAAELGWRIIRVVPDDLETAETFDLIREFIKTK